METSNLIPVTEAVIVYNVDPGGARDVRVFTLAE
jgi:hypothetical protein